MPRQMTAEERAAYMRDYRARRKTEAAQAAVALSPLVNVHAACDAEIAGLRRRIAELEAGKTTGETSVDVSTGWKEMARQEIAARTTPAQKEAVRQLLAAPDDDCASCGHDRHAYHLGGPCQCPTGPRRKCLCPVWVAPLDEIEPF